MRYYPALTMAGCRQPRCCVMEFRRVRFRCPPLLLTLYTVGVSRVVATCGLQLHQYVDDY